MNKRMILVFLIGLLVLSSSHADAACVGSKPLTWWEMIFGWVLSLFFCPTPSICPDEPVPPPVKAPVEAPLAVPVKTPTSAPFPVPVPVPVNVGAETPVQAPVDAPVVTTCGGLRPSKAATAPSSSSIQIYDAFANMRGLFYWPTPKSGPDRISSTFGPRKKYSSGGRYDWHRGVDITGNSEDDILATFGGKVLKAEYIGSGGLTVILEHTFKDSMVEFNGHIVEKWDTHYNHLSNFSVSPTDVVMTGQMIGLMGKTGDTNVTHLHHEVRVGTYCSLEYAVSNPSSSCNNFNFDPHVHPLFVYPASTIPCSSFTVVVSQEPTAATDAIVEVSTEDRVPDINRFKVQVVEPGLFSDTIWKEYTLDLNLRTGYNATSTASLDTQDRSKPYLDPQQFVTLDKYWIMDFVVPRSWVGPKKATEEIVVTITNTWHDTWKTIRFGKGSSWD